MTIQEFVLNFIAEVKENNKAKGKDYKGCHTVFAMVDGFNLNDAIRTLFGAHLTDADAIKRFPIEQVKEMIKQGIIVGHPAFKGFMVYHLGDAMVNKVKDVSALRARMESRLAPPPVIVPVATRRGARATA